MKTFYLVGNDDGIRFVPSLALSHILPCMVYGVMSVDDEHCFSTCDLKSFNDVVRKVLKNE